MGGIAVIKDIKNLLRRVMEDIMKCINYIFYSGVFIIILLIASPIYWQYEVNKFHDASNFYQINDFRGETVEKSYGLLEDVSKKESNTFYIVRPTSLQVKELKDDKYYFNFKDKKNNYIV